MSGPFDVYVVGLGMVVPTHITTEADRALSRAAETYLLHFDSSVEGYLQRRYGAVRSLGDLYEIDKPRRVTYREVAKVVLDAAQSRSPVALAMYGHPLMFVSPTKLILRDGRKQGLRVKVIPGISSLAGLMIDLEFDPADEGLQMYEATDLLLRERPLQSDVPCLIWQIGTVGSLIYECESYRSAAPLEGLSEYLMRFYPAEHKATIARTPTLAIGHPRLLEATVGGLPKLYEVVESADTLFLPSTGQRPTSNRELADRLIAQETEHDVR